MSEFDKITERYKVHVQWLRKNHPAIMVEQKHLDAGSNEQVYWNYGYATALRDVIKLMTGTAPEYCPLPETHASGGTHD